ncbi:MAG: LysR family transcriptional regulator [Deltaproteobacteria bacterium]|jgi:DNA-binding transcriptional LysR family regulator|nr:LysR family transcriptional regulator [Deltaproteobacteria bacterium]
MARDLNVDQIKKLWILQLVIEEGSLKKASLRAKVTPSAVSQTVTALEQSYGRPLLVREKNGVVPTADAVAVLEIVRPAFEAFERLRAYSDVPLPKVSWISFGTYESIAVDVLPGFVRSLKVKLPSVRLSVRISRTANLLTMVRKGELCSALITETDDLDRFYVKEVAEDRLGFFVGRGHPMLKLGWSSLEKYSYGSLSSGKDGLPRYFTKFLKGAGSLKPNLVSDSFEALRAAGAAGVVPVVLPARVARRNDDLVEITPHNLRDTGRHRLLIVSQASCDRQETDFVANEASVHLRRQNV